MWLGSHKQTHIKMFAYIFFKFFNTLSFLCKISSSTFIGGAFSYLPFLITRFISPVPFIKSFMSITQQLRLAILLREGIGIIIPMRSYIFWVGSRKAMVFMFGKGVALCVGKGFAVVFGLVFSRMRSFFSIRSSTLCFKAWRQSVLWPRV